MDSESKMITDLQNLSQALATLAQALATAVQMRFMSPEHAALVWKKSLGHSGLDVTKTTSKGGEKDVS